MKPSPRRLRHLAGLLVLALLLAPAALGKKKDPRLEELPERYEKWLDTVELLISEEETELFLSLDKDFRRDAFIEEFWKVRDPYPGTARNELREHWDEWLEFVRREFEEMTDERTRIFMLNGPPAARVEVRCSPLLWPIEVWYYDGSEQVGFEFLLLFYQRWGKGLYRAWEPFYGLEDLFQQPGGGVGARLIQDRCLKDGDAVVAALSFMASQNQLGAATLLARLKDVPEPPEKEWVATFGTYSTDLPEGAETFPAELDLAYPGYHQSRTVAQGTVLVPAAELTTSQVGDFASYNLLLNGEILRGEELFERFRYKFDVPKSEAAEEIPLTFQRYLRPGEYTLLLKAEDVNSGRFHRIEREIEVPEVDRLTPPTPLDPETARILEEANRAITTGENTVKLAPLHGEWQTDLVRLDALVTGSEIDEVTFFLDDQPILTKKRPPYSVELDLGTVPRARVVRVEAFDEAGDPIASDETMINAGRHRFDVRLVEPHPKKTYSSSVRAQADVVVPEGEVVERVEFYLNETLVATLYQEPWIQPIALHRTDPTAYVRVVAHTVGGTSTEDVVFLNNPNYLESIDVDLVELYTLVLDKAQRPVEGLEEKDFTVYEDGVQQEIGRFEVVRNLPIHVAAMLDVSASMDGRLEATQAAALGFFEKAITPKDRGAIVTFNDHPNLATGFTSDMTDVAAGLAGLRAERGTALWDSLIFTLYYFNGIKGQRAILLLSDGKDEASRFSFGQSLEFAQRAGVSIYVVGLDFKRKEADARRSLNRLADATGGRAFWIDDTSELEAVYDTIQLELRSRYFISYQSSNESGSKTFRRIEVEVVGAGLEAKTMQGYFP